MAEIELTEVGSFDDLLKVLGEKLANSARQWTDKQWQEALQQSTRGMAQDILRHVPDLPRLVNFTAAAGGTSTFMTFESDACEFTVTINATRKRPPVNAPTFGQKPTGGSDAAQVRIDERREEPAWPFRKSDAKSDA